MRKEPLRIQTARDFTIVFYELQSFLVYVIIVELIMADGLIYIFRSLKKVIDDDE